MDLRQDLGEEDPYHLTNPLEATREEPGVEGAGVGRGQVEAVGLEGQGQIGLHLQEEAIMAEPVPGEATDGA